MVSLQAEGADVFEQMRGLVTNELRRYGEEQTFGLRPRSACKGGDIGE